MRTKEQIQEQVDGLHALKAKLPEYSAFGTPNHQIFDAQIEILEGGDIDDMDEGDWDEMDEQNEIFREAEQAVDWLEGDLDDDLYE